ncbi:transglutaminase-like cysteine peptidase [Bradyrhizobium sp. AZCC 1577]|uniref:transglutaminase-like cysteine peptidase n=1 Tax=Bradyrhizobium sp. AZCC 1577 TaxID=3117019 RepID=UPI002FEF02C5
MRDRNDDGRAVLTVVTDKGEFVLDNETAILVPWADTGYRSIKRQSQTNTNQWVSVAHRAHLPPRQVRADLDPRDHVRGSSLRLACKRLPYVG